MAPTHKFAYENDIIGLKNQKNSNTHPNENFF